MTVSDTPLPIFCYLDRRIIYKQQVLFVAGSTCVWADEKMGLVLDGSIIAQIIFAESPFLHVLTLDDSCHVLLSDIKNACLNYPHEAECSSCTKHRPKKLRLCLESNPGTSNVQAQCDTHV
ncbi:hypothetical protein M8J77_008095 [Diaphorina citri]|nr:hypothetical protein M8J77_008095 [Diaphorina citri]